MTPPEKYSIRVHGNWEPYFSTRLNVEEEIFCKLCRHAYTVNIFAIRVTVLRHFDLGVVERLHRYFTNIFDIR